MKWRELSRKTKIALLAAVVAAAAIPSYFWIRSVLLLRCERDYAITLTRVQAQFEHNYEHLLEEKANGKLTNPQLLPFNERANKSFTGYDQDATSKEEQKEIDRVVDETRERLEKAGSDEMRAEEHVLVANFGSALAQGLLPFPIIDGATREILLGYCDPQKYPDIVCDAAKKAKCQNDGANCQTILPYPGLFDNATRRVICPEKAVCNVPKPIKDAMAEIIHDSESVGRLALAPKDYSGRAYEPTGVRKGAAPSKQTCAVSTDNQPTAECLPYFWGTAFMIAKGVVATSCHEIDSLLKKEDGVFKFKLDDDTKLIIDFGFTADTFPATWDIDTQNFLGCGDREGLDIAFLQLVPNGQTYPEALTLYLGVYDDKNGPPLALIGYADLQHFADSVTERIYRVFARDPDFNYDKFALLDASIPVPACSRYTDQVLHIASTTVGASGSVLIDIDPDDRNFGSVVAMHTCCSNFFYQPQGKPPESDLPCAHLTRTFANQALGSWRILNDRNLCSSIKRGDPSFQCASN